MGHHGFDLGELGLEGLGGVGVPADDDAGGEEVELGEGDGRLRFGEGEERGEPSGEPGEEAHVESRGPVS